MFDDDDKKAVPQNFPARLDGLSVAELDDYLDALNAEIARVQADKASKQASRDAASSIFKS